MGAARRRACWRRRKKTRQRGRSSQHGPHDGGTIDSANANPERFVGQCVYAENVSREPRRPCNDVDRRPRAWQHPYWCSGTWRAGPFTLIAEKLRLADNTIKEGSSAVRRGVGAEIAASFRAERDNGTHDGGQERAP
jgi:hypothetical protein